MDKIIFIYNHNQYSLNIDNTIITNIYKYIVDFISIIKKSSNDLYFICKGKPLSSEDMKKEIDLKAIKNHYFKIFVYDLDCKKKEVNEENIICPECENISILDIKNSKFSIVNCKFNHKITNLPIDLFIYLQNFVYKEIKCSECNNNSCLYNRFLYCSCDNFICPLCEIKHINKNNYHNLIDYKKRLNFCKIHNKKYNSYCLNCKMNLCISCEGENHINNSIEFFIKKENLIDNLRTEIFIDINKTKSKINDYLNELGQINKNVFDYINQIKTKMNYYIKVYDIITKILNNLGNYENRNCILNLKNKTLFNEVNNIFEEVNIKFKHFLLKNNNKNKESDDIIIIYKNKGNKNKIKIFGEEFVKNNKGNCSIIINNKKNSLCENYEFDENEKKNNLIIKLTDFKKIKDTGDMFNNCKALVSLPNIDILITHNIKRMTRIFSGCESLDALDFSTWNTSNVTDMGWMFNKCYELKEIKGINLIHLKLLI